MLQDPAIAALPALHPTLTSRTDAPLESLERSILLAPAKVSPATAVRIGVIPLQPHVHPPGPPIVVVSAVPAPHLHSPPTAL